VLKAAGAGYELKARRGVILEERSDEGSLSMASDER
jgi:hypothetical protein